MAIHPDGTSHHFETGYIIIFLVPKRYVRQSLRRKLEMLDDPDLFTDPEENLQRMLSVLGRLAEELQCSKKPYVSLKRLAAEPGMEFARLLWGLSGEVGDAITRGLESRAAALAEEHKAIIDALNREQNPVTEVRLKRALEENKEELRSIDEQGGKLVVHQLKFEG